MIDINLLSWRQSQRTHAKQRILLAVMLMIVLGLTVLACLHMWMQVKLDKQMARNHFLTQTIAMKDQQIRILQHRNEALPGLTSSVQLLKDIPNNKRRLSGFLAELSNIEASKVHITKINLDHNNIVFSGRASSRGAISVLVKNINQSHWLEAPQIREIMEHQGVRHEQDFELVATIKDQYGKRG